MEPKPIVPSTVLGIHAIHPALSVATSHSRRLVTVDEDRQLSQLQEQIAGLVLQAKERERVLEEQRLENKELRRQLDVYKTLCSAGTRHHSAELNASSEAAMVPAPPSHISTTPLRRLRRAYSALSTAKEHEAAAEPLLIERTKDLQDALRDITAASETLCNQWGEKSLVYDAQVTLLRDQLTSLTVERDELHKRLAEDILRHHSAVNMFNVLTKLKSQRRTREASMKRLEALECCAMSAHDDQMYVRRWESRDFPDENICMVFVDFVASGDLHEKLPHLAPLVLRMYYETIKQAARDYAAILSHVNGPTLLYVLRSPIDALEFVCSVNVRLLAVPWPDSLLHEPLFASMVDVATGTTIFSGPRTRFGISFGSCATEFDCVTGRRFCVGAEVLSTGRLAALARPGEICASLRFKERLESMTASLTPAENPFGDLSSWYGNAVAVRAQPPVVSMVPPSFAARRTYWKKELGSYAAMRLLPDWADKFDNLLYWAAPPVGRGRSNPAVSTSVSSSAPRNSKRFVAVRASFQAAQRALAVREQELMASFDVLLNRSIEAPSGRITLVAGRVAHFGVIQSLGDDTTSLVTLAVLGEAKQITDRYNGYWVKSDRECFLAAFKDQRDALEAAASIHSRLLTVTWPEGVRRVFPDQYVQVPSTSSQNDSASSPQPVRRKVFGGPTVALGVNRCAPDVRRHQSTFRVDYAGNAVTLVALLCSAARPGETLLGEAASKELRSTSLLTTGAVAAIGQGVRTFTALAKPESVLSVLPSTLAPRFRLWTSPMEPRAQKSRSPVAPKNAKTATSDAPGNVAPAAVVAENIDGDVELRMRRLASLPLAPPSLDTPRDVVRQANEVPKLIRERRKLLSRLRAVEQATMLTFDDASMLGAVPHMGPSVAVAMLDVEGSDRLLKSLSGLFVVSQQHYNYLVISLAKRHDGYRIKHNGGDAFLYSFANASDALAFSLDLQLALNTTEWPLELVKHESALRVKDAHTGGVLYNGLRCRIGIASGAMVQTAFNEYTRRTDYFGPLVNAAWRAAASSPGGATTLTPEALADVMLGDNGPVRCVGFMVSAPALQPNSKATMHVLYPTALFGRAKLPPTTATKQAREDESNQKSVQLWWRSSQHSVTPVAACRLTEGIKLASPTKTKKAATRPAVLPQTSPEFSGSITAQSIVSSVDSIDSMERTKYAEQIRRLAVRVDAIYQAVHGVPSFCVSYRKVAWELEETLRLARQLLMGSSDPTLSNGVLVPAFSIERPLDLMDDEQTAQRREMLSRSNRRTTTL